MCEVIYTPLETFHGILQQQSVNVSGAETSAVLNDLEEFVTYNISVVVYATIRNGLVSNSVTATTMEDCKC